MEEHVNGNTIAALIAASTAAMVSLATLYMQFINWKDARDIKLRTTRLEQGTKRIEEEGTKREKKIDDLHSAVNGRLSELKIRISKESFEMGRHFEKLHPGEPSPQMPRPIVEELMEQIADVREAASAKTIG